MVTRSVVREQRINDICALVRETPGETYSITMLASKVGGSWSTIANYCDDIARENSQFVRDDKGLTFVLTPEDVADKKEDTSKTVDNETAHDIFFAEGERKGMDKFPITRNDEGYYDPTAAAVLKAERKEEGRKESDIWPISSFKTGEVWAVSANSGGRIDNVVILAINKADERIVVCPYDTRLPRAFMNITTKPVKYFKTKICGLPLSFSTELNNNLRDFFGIAPIIKTKTVEKEVKVEVPVEVEKIVEKEVKVEVPVTDGKEYSKAEVDALLAEQRAEIYEKCFNMLAKTK